MSFLSFRHCSSLQSYFLTFHHRARPEGVCIWVSVWVSLGTHPFKLFEFFDDLNICEKHLSVLFSSSRLDFLHAKHIHGIVI